MKQIKIKMYDLMKAQRPLENYIINKLVKEGAPIKVLRKNKFDFTEYNESEIKYTGNITKYNDSNGDLIFSWGSSDIESKTNA